MIVKGYIATNKGYVEISELTKDYKLVNMSTSFSVTGIKKSKTKTIVKFKNNPFLEVTLNSKIYTLYGTKNINELNGKTVYLQQANSRVLPDEITIVHLEKPVPCYEIVSEEPGTFFCEGYAFITGDNKC